MILVDATDQIIGHLDKSRCHNGNGVLHRAFSLFIFNPDGDLLLQQRAAEKRLWPGFWSNSCCSHPRKGEELAQAAQRRCEQELGFRTPLQFLYKFEYQAQFRDLGSEHELCSVFCGVYDGEIRANENEISAWQWLAPVAINAQLQAGADTFTPWFQLEWQHLQTHFAQIFATR